MKILIKQSFLYLVFAVLAFSFTACSDDEPETTPQEQAYSDILGTWNTTSFTQNAVEQMGTEIRVLTIEFNDISAGVYTYEINTEEIDGTTDVETGQYTINVVGDELTLTGLRPDNTLEDPNLFDLVLSSTEMTMTGNLNDGLFILSADKL